MKLGELAIFQGGLESVDSSDITFTQVDPTDYRLNYYLELSDDAVAGLCIDDSRKLAVMLIPYKKG